MNFKLDYNLKYVNFSYNHSLVQICLFCGGKHILRCQQYLQFLKANKVLKNRIYNDVMMNTKIF